MTLLVILLFQICQAASYHEVGWFNLFVPGGGEYLRGRSDVALGQFGLEVPTFALGYNLSAKSPMTLDGVPEDLPEISTIVLPGTPTRTVCSKYNRTTHTCTTYRTIHGTSPQVIDNSSHDLSRSLVADILQEIGIKAHMINVFDSWRKAATDQGIDLRSRYIDDASLKDLFLSPFEKATLYDPWVYVALGVTGAALFYSYESLKSDHSYPAIPKLNTTSKILFGSTYLGVFPVGSAAPEEMFYRGFLQSELQSIVSPWLAIPLSSTLYGFSHSTDDRLPALASGLFEGYLTYRNHGKLKRAIAYHFWSDVLTGIYTIAVLHLSQQDSATSAPVSMSFSLEY